MIFRALFTVLFFFISIPYGFAENKISVLDAVESFQIYCFETKANFTQIERLIRPLKLKQFPDDVASAAGGPDALTTKLYLVKKAYDNSFILLGFSKPNACSIMVRGIKFLPIRSLMIEQFKLAYHQTLKIGSHINEIYIPGGVLGKEQDAVRFGSIMLQYPKPSMGNLEGTIGYFPPDEAKKLLNIYR
jgi:hypothetical protein